MRSLSATILQQLLRQNMGFEGVIISDSTNIGNTTECSLAW
nr:MULTISPECIES: glycoside hydrolase family 3 N-terminal domain-containing protein [unclassified Vibrio]